MARTLHPRSMGQTRRALLTAAGALLAGGGAGVAAADAVGSGSTDGRSAAAEGNETATATPTANGTANGTPTANGTVNGTPTGTGTPTDQFAVSFAVFPGSPRVGQQVLLVVALTGSSRGRVATARWDLDGDGTFDRSGSRIEHIFSEAGWRTVTLRVETESGEVITEERDIGVMPEDTPTPTDDPSSLGTEPAGGGGDGGGDGGDGDGDGESLDRRDLRAWVLGGLLALSAAGWVWGR